MMLERKFERAMDWLKGQSPPKKETDYDSDLIDPKMEWLMEEEAKVKLEKGDGFALFLSAFLIFGPIILILFVILFLLV